MNIAQQKAYHGRRVAHRNVAAVTAAMQEAGVLSVVMRVRSDRGAGGAVLLDMDWNYDNTALEGEGHFPDVNIEDLHATEDGVTSEIDAVPFREAVRKIGRDTLETLAPDEGRTGPETGRIGIVARERVATLALGPEDGQWRVRDLVAAYDPLSAFGEVGIDAEPLTGWREIATPEAGQVAGQLSQTAIGVLHDQFLRGEPMYAEKVADGTRWFAHIDLVDGAERAGILVAAQPDSGFDPDTWPRDGHVFGYRNENVYGERVEEIRALAEREGLVIAPNHLGQAIDADDHDDEGIEP